MDALHAASSAWYVCVYLDYQSMRERERVIFSFFAVLRFVCSLRNARDCTYSDLVAEYRNFRGRSCAASLKKGSLDMGIGASMMIFKEVRGEPV